MVELPDGRMRIYYVDISSISAFKIQEGGHGEFRLEQNYPNPFRMITSFNLELPVQDYVTLKIYNLPGLEIVTLVNGILCAGLHSAVWNAHNVPDGSYIRKLQVGDRSEVKKLILIK